MTVTSLNEACRFFLNNSSGSCICESDGITQVVNSYTEAVYFFQRDARMTGKIMNTPSKTKPETKRERILIVENDISHYARKLQKLHSKIGWLEKQRKILREKISRKHVYLIQLHQDPE